MFCVFVNGTSSSELSSEEGRRFFSDKLLPADFKITLVVEFLDAETSSELSSEDESSFYDINLKN